MRLIRLIIAAGLAGAIVGCGDSLLEVDNTSNPDRTRILRTAADAEALAGAQFQQIISATLGSTTRTQIRMLTISFENASGLANNGLGPPSNFPRPPIDNGRGNPYQGENFADFTIHSSVAKNAALVLARAADTSAFKLSGDTTVHRQNLQRLYAWTYFVYGVGLGNLSLVYDSAGIPRPTDEARFVPALEGYAAVNAYALKQLDSALVYATKSGTSSLAAGWLTGPGGATVTMANFQKVIRSYRARLRAGVARNVTERIAVDWTAVIADATTGIDADLTVKMDPNQGWDVAWLQTGTAHYRSGEWHQMPYHIIGMADSSGGYEAWLRTPRDSRTPFLILTRDARFPAGATRAAQSAVGQGQPTGRRIFRNRTEGSLDVGSIGWRVSQYDHYRFRSFADAGRIGDFPIFTKAELDMLAAEGHIRTGNIAAAALLIDKTRTTAGLPALTGMVTTINDPVPGGASCVPRIPVAPTYTTTACGNILEAMKWEKRMETAYTTYGAWFFDSRGWGDLALGTAIQWPVPNQELDARLKPLYTQGGIGAPGGATLGTYGFGSGDNV
jgi:hypothetical protein